MKETTRLSYHERILRVLVHLQKHLDESVSLEELAGVAHMSPWHFHRVFRAQVGEGVMEHIRRLRLERAALLLKVSSRKVARIAFEAGYETHEAFTRAFTAAFEIAPVEYRKKNRTVPRLPSPNDVHFSERGDVDHFEAQSIAETLDVTVEDIPARRVAFVHHRGRYDGVGKAWDTLMGWAGKKGLFRGQVWMCGISFDDPSVTDTEFLRYHACMEVDESIQAEGEIGVMVIPAGRYAHFVHQGPMHQFTDTYNKFFGGWLPKNGYLPGDGPGFEVYRSNFDEVPPSEWVTDIYAPIVKE